MTAQEPNIIAPCKAKWATDETGETAEAPPVADKARLFRGSGTISGRKASGNCFATTVVYAQAKATGKEWYNRAGNYLQKEADRARMLSENAYLRGSRGLNNAQTLLFDGTVAGTQMAGDIALGTLTGGSVDMAQTGSGQVSSYADALRKIQSEQNATALGTNADSFDARYQELERKYLNGSISPDEGEELWKLEHMKGQFSKPSEHVGIAPKSAEWDAQKKSRELESDSLISMGRKARAMLTGNKAIAFSSLPGKMKVEFEERLSSAYPDVETALRKICSSAKYRLGTDQRSFYTSSKVEKDGVIIDEDTITIGTRGSASTIAHELFHKLDKEGVIGSELSDSLMQDYIALNIQSNGDIKSYLSLKFQTAFVQSLDGDLVMKPEYAGISDILNGLSGGTISYGYGHKKGYWADSGSLEAETWADFGRTYYDNKSDVINMFEEIFPNLSKKAKEKLKELL